MRVVNLEVVVTDRDGNRVRGLGVGDFRLRVDGIEVPIDYFSEVAEGAATAGAAGSSVKTVPSLEPGSKLRTNFLVFIDDFFAVGPDRDRVLDHLQEQAAELGSDDRMAIVAFDGRALELLAGWTRDPEALATALDRARKRKTFGLQRLAEVRTNDSQRRERKNLELLNVERIQSAGGDPPERSFLDTRLDGVELEYANRLAEQVRRSVLGAVSALRSFAGPNGRKVMLLLAGGWPFSPAEYALNTYLSGADDSIAGIADTTLLGRNRLFGPLVDTANLLGYTLYPVDVPGQDREFGFDASEGFGELDQQSPTAGAGGTARSRELAIHDGLSFLAQSTGGTALINSLRDRSLAEVIADTRSFYWLGFTPERNEDDAGHEIDVEVVGRPDLRVRARAGFVDLSRGTEVTMIVESALLFGEPPTNKPLALRFGRPHRAGLGKMRVPLEVGMLMDEITLLPSQGRYVNELEIRVTVMDPQGNRSETTVDKISINGSAPPQPGQMYFYETELRLRDKNHRIVVAVYDPLSGVILSSSGEITGR